MTEDLGILNSNSNLESIQHHFRRDIVSSAHNRNNTLYAMSTSLEQASHHARLVTGLLECTGAMTTHREPCEAVTRLVTGLLQPRILARLVTGLLEASTTLARTHAGYIIGTYAGASLVQASNKPVTSLASMRGLLQACWNIREQ